MDISVKEKQTLQLVTEPNQGPEVGAVCLGCRLDHRGAHCAPAPSRASCLAPAPPHLACYVALLSFCRRGDGGSED